MNKRRSRILAGLGLILCGALLLFLGSAKQVKIVVNGKPGIVTTHASRVSDILRGAGFSYTASDRIRPSLKTRVPGGGLITLDQSADVVLLVDGGSDPLRFPSFQHFGGNILLDAGYRLFPGDKLYWNDTEVQPEFNFSGMETLSLRIDRADTFTLVTESSPEGVTAYGKGASVMEALLSAGIRTDKSLRIFPDGSAPFVPGMTVEVLPLHQLTIAEGGRLFAAESAGVTVGDALARAGFPLMGSAVSIPAAGEPLPADGRVLIVPVSDSFSMNAETVRRQIEWTASEELELDSTRLITEGHDGLKGTFTRTRLENGETVLNETSEKTVLVQPVSDRAEYGTKVNIRTLDTPDGPIEYYRSVKVYATSYSPCRSGTSSCITGTASGMKVGKGVAAVSSSWYNQFGGQSVYIPDYGKAVIADVGGGIPGRNWIDLAYDDDNFVSWSKETTLYFLTPVPADMVWVLQ